MITAFFFSWGNTQELPSLNTTLDLSHFCGSENDSEGFETSTCLPFRMKVPKGTRLISKSWSTEITLDENFNISVDEGDYEYRDDGTKVPAVRIGFGPFLPYSKELLINERKKEWEENDMNELVEYTYEDENGFIAKTNLFGQFEYHFFFTAYNGEVSFTFENVKGPAFTEAECNLMYESLKTIKWN